MIGETKVEKLVENSWAKLVARFAVPALLGLLVYFAQGIDKSVEEVERAQWKLFGKVEHLSGVTQEQINGIKDRVDKAEGRLDQHDRWFGEIWRKNISGAGE